MKALILFLENLIPYDGSLQTLLISIIMAVTVCMSVIVTGAGIESIEKLEFKLLTRCMSPKKAIFVENRLTFPGTMLHETAHALLAWLTGAVIVKMRLLTFFDAHRLGYVCFRPRGNRIQRCFQLSIASCAPVLLGLIELQVLWRYIFITDSWLRALLIYLFISIFNHMSMSTKDIKNYCKGLVIVLPVMTLVFYFIQLIIR